MSSIHIPVTVDNIGNAYAKMDARGVSATVPSIMIHAHADSIGFMVHYIDEKGFIFTKDIPGYCIADQRNLPNTAVRILSRRNHTTVRGHFVSPVPVHLLQSGEEDDPIERHYIPIDIGAPDDEVAGENVAIGDYVVFDPIWYRQQINGENIVATSLDDRLGLFGMYKLAKHLQRTTKRPEITFVSTVAEEIWSGGAKVAAENVRPDIAIALDCSAVADQIRDAEHDVAKRYNNSKLGGGPILVRGPSVHDPTFLHLEAIAQGEVGKWVFAHQVEPGFSGMAEHHQTYAACQGIRSAGIFFPARYCHTPREMVEVEDITLTLDLLAGFCQSVARGEYKP